MRREAYSRFVQEALVERTRSFNVPIKKLNLLTFEKLAKSANVPRNLSKSQLKEINLEHHISKEMVVSFPGFCFIWLQLMEP